MISLQEKYPLLMFEELEELHPELPPDELARRRHALWDRQRQLLSQGRAYVKKIDLFLGCLWHDAEILSVDYGQDCLSICVNDPIFFTCFEIVDGLLGFNHPAESLKCPVTLRLDGVRCLKAYALSQDEPFVFLPAEADAVVPDLREFLYDELASVTQENVSLGLNLETRQRKSVLLDVEARSISFEEDLRSHFATLFGAGNLDVFDAFFKARAERAMGWDCADAAIRILRSLRSERSANTDIKNYYVRLDLDKKAERLIEAGDGAGAVELYLELIRGKFDIALCKKLGKLLFRMERHNESLLYLYSAAGRNPRDLDVRFHIVRSLYALGRLAETADELELCLSADPKFGGALKFIAEHPELRDYLDEDDDEQPNEA